MRLPKVTRVKNKAPADVQITAEQILRDARSQQEVEIKPASVKFSDSQELAQYRVEKVSQWVTPRIHSPRTQEG